VTTCRRVHRCRSSGTSMFLSDPIAPDEIHPVGEVVWDSMESTTNLNADGIAIETETRGVLRAMVDGATGSPSTAGATRCGWRPRPRIPAAP
jgi:hypothetical protein